MADKIMRISEENHAIIAEKAAKASCSANDVITALLKAEGDKVMVALAPGKKRPFFPTRCRINNLERIAMGSRVPQGINPKALPFNMANVGLAVVPLDGFPDIPWMETKHPRADVFSYLCGKAAVGNRQKRIRADAVDYLKQIKECFLCVTEEDIGIFVPVNMESRMALKVLCIGGDDYEAREYLTSLDLFMLWHAGYEIQYMETI